MGKQPSELRLQQTDDYESMVKLGRDAGLDIETLGPVLTAYGILDEEELVGCACLKEHEGAYLLECLAVKAEYRGKGLGTRLVRKVEEDAKSRGANRILALARSPGFFKKVGFRVTDPGEVDFPSLSGCSSCPQFCTSCSPAVVLKEL